MVSRSRSTIWLGLPGERHLERSFRLQAAWQSLPEMLQVTGGQGGEKLWSCAGFKGQHAVAAGMVFATS